MVLTKKIIFLIAAFFWAGFSIAQQSQKKGMDEVNKYHILHWSVDDGLPYDQTYCMLKDVNGFLWIGTTEGLSRFDGSTFKNYFYDPKKKETIAGSKVLGLVEDSIHNIWIGTDKGLSRYDIKADTFTNFSPTILNATLTSFIIPFFNIKDELYCWETDSLITSYNIHSFRKKILLKLTAEDKVGYGDYIKQYSFFDVRSNSVWILTSVGGLLQIPLLTKERKYYGCPWSESMCYDQKRNSLWLNSDGGLLEFTLADKQFHHVEALNKVEKLKGYFRFVGIDLDAQGRIWFATYPKGIIIYDPSNPSVKFPSAEDSLLQKIISYENGCIYCDRDGITWTGFWLRKGIYQITSISPPVKRYLADSSKNPWRNIILNCVNAGNGKIWMGTDEDGIIVFDVRNNSYQTLQLKNLWSFETRPTVMPVYIDTAKQKAILRIQDKMYFMDIPSKKCIPITFKDRNNKTINITKVFESKKFNNTCIINAEYDGRSCFFHMNIDSAIANEILSFPKNIIDENYATNDDRYLFLKELVPKSNATYAFVNGKWNHTVNPLDSIDWRNIVYNNADKSYWILAPAQLFHYDLNFHFIHEYTPENGLPYNEIFILLPDDKGNIWFNTNRYIYRLDAKTHVITQLSEKDGYVHEDFRGGGYGIKYNGNLYFPGHGSAQGLVVITPDKYVSTPASVYFKSINIKEYSLPKSISINNTRQLNLKYFQNRIVIETGTIDYYSYKKGKIRYKLSERNENWQYAPSNYTIRYEELPPGNYTLLVQAGNAGNEFTGPVKSLRFYISKAWWNTWWLRIVAAIFILGTFYAIVRYRTRQKFLLQLERSEKEKQLAENAKQLAELQQQKTEIEMQALRAQMNPHFIFNSLNSINRFILKKQSSEATEYLTKFSKLIRMILNSSANASVSLAEDLEALQLYLELERLRCEQKFSFKIKYDPEIDAHFIQIPPMLLQPFVENAIWHGLMNKEGEGHLWINIDQEDSTLICTITDDGIGRKKAAELKSKSAYSYKSMGMRITADRIAMLQQQNQLKTSIQVTDLILPDGNAGGTEVLIKIPLHYD
jgi:ligand-binding sensor domain-containing protein